jgi:NTE family protein
MSSLDLVLEGGGVKGIAFAGAIEVLETHGYRFNRIAGTSAGAIAGALVAAGATAEKLRKYLEDLDYERFRDPPWRLGPLGAAAAVALYKGWCRGEYFRSWLDEKLTELGVRTFADLVYDDDGVKDPDRAFRFVAMASDVTHGELVRLPWHYRTRFGVNPAEVPVVDAVRASMAIPYYFRPSKLDLPTGRQAWLVDGGMLSNFPIDVFDCPPGVEPRWPTFGIKLSGRDASTSVNEVRGVASLSRAMLNTMTGFYDRIHVAKEEVRARTIFVDTGGIRATDFDLSPDQADWLYESGRSAATAFLAGWDFEEYKRRFRV